MREREIKRKISPLLEGHDFPRLLEEVREFPSQRVISTLMSGLYKTNETVKWNCVSLMGEIVNDLAHQDMEAARIIMRQLLWNLNEESGGIGWGMPEAMGEVLAVNSALAGEYTHMLVSYMREENYLELPALQHGLMWGLGRLASVHPDLLLKFDADGYMSMYLESSDRIVLGLASRNFGILNIKEAIPLIRGFVDIDDQLHLYQDFKIVPVTVGELAREALARLEKQL